MTSERAVVVSVTGGLQSDDRRRENLSPANQRYRLKVAIVDLQDVVLVQAEPVTFQLRHCAGFPRHRPARQRPTALQALAPGASPEQAVLAGSAARFVR